MTRRMFRYTVPVDDQPHHFDLDSGPLHVQADEFSAQTALHAGDHIVEFWAERDTNKPAYRRAFQVFGTGHVLPDDAAWVGTCDRLPSGLVWHLFEVTP